ncbi:MAG: hypothetical protein F9K19_10225 [Rhizobiaceae bacterium]|nr:MAG: hypothetical protein F9K19_10225 [Rhizobiaceae bacterium]
MTHRRARFVATVPLLVSGLVLAGCMSSPTYGTGTPADEQLLSDLSSALALGPSNKERIDYKPRPDLVKPAPTALANLPAPQESVIATANPAWPESPEQRLKRIRDEATANQENASYESPVISDVPSRPGVTSAARIGERGNFDVIDSPARQREAFNKRLAETKQGSPTKRKYLSEPPLVYRAPSDAAPVDDVGEDEWKKERRQKRAARKERSWRDLIPTL